LGAVVTFPGITVGTSLTVSHTVSEADTSGGYLPDDIHGLLSSPGLAGIMIHAAASLINPLLPDGFISVGKSISLTHEHPSVIGAIVDLTVTISEFHGYHVTLSMEATDESGLIGTGTHVRSIVNEHWLHIRLHHRLENP
jgi:predicted thioesterase